MNKYQEALNELASYYDYDDYPKILQELVDRATPKKPNMENLNYICCPNCHSDEIELFDYYRNEVKLKRCNNCGQQLDWSNNES